MRRPSTAHPPPVAGEQFKAVARHRIEGTKRRKLLALIAAFADAGEPSPTVRELGRRLGLEGVPGVRRIDGLLRRLEADGLLEIQWQQGEGLRNIYRITLDPRGEAGATAAPARQQEGTRRGSR